MAAEQLLNHVGVTPHNPGDGTTHETARANSVRCLRSAVDASPDAILIIDAELRILLYNKAAELVFGYAAEETLGRSLDMLIAPRYRSGYRDDIARLGNRSGSWPATLHKSMRGLRAGDVEFPCEVAFSDADRDDGQPPMYVAIIHDASGRRRAQEALRKSEALLVEAQHIAHIGHWEWTAPGRDLICSPEVLSIFGLPPESITIAQRALVEMMHPDDRARVSQLDRDILAGRRHIDYEYRVIQPAGGVRWVHQQASVIYSEDGRPLHMTGILQDITERKQAEQGLRDRAALLERVIALGKNVSAITGLDRCAREIHRGITAGLGFDRAGIFLYDAAADRLCGLYGSDRAGQIIDIHGKTLRADQAASWLSALESPHGLYVTAEFQVTHDPPADSTMFGVRQHITLAAWAGEVPVAMIAVDNLCSQRPVLAIELEALQLFAGYIGLSLANARLHAALEQRVAAQSAELRAANAALERVS